MWVSFWITSFYTLYGTDRGSCAVLTDIIARHFKKAIEKGRKMPFKGTIKVLNLVTK